MSEIQRIGDLEIDEDIGFQRRIWTAQRVGWAVIALLLGAAALGAFGGKGPLTTAEVAGPEGLTLAYHRISRHGSRESFAIRLPAGGAARDDTVALWVDRAYLQGLTIHDVTPEPAGVAAGAERITWVFRVQNPSAPIEVKLTLESDDLFVRAGALGVVDGPSLSFRQFVLP